MAANNPYLIGALIMAFVLMLGATYFTRKREQELALERMFGDNEESAIKDKKPFAPKWERLAKQAGLNSTGLEITLWGVLCCAVVWLVGFLIVGRPLLAVLFAPLGMFIPVGYLKSRIRQREQKMRESMKDSFLYIANLLRSGSSLGIALSMVADKAEEPLRTVLQRAKREIGLGVPVIGVLETIEPFIPVAEYRHFLLSAQIQTQTGGDLAELIDEVVVDMEDEDNRRGQLKSLTTQGRLTGNIVGGLPFVSIVVLRLISPTYFDPLLNSAGGTLLFVSMLLLVVSGFFVIRRICYA